MTEVQRLLTDRDPALNRTPDGFRIRRNGREDVVHQGPVDTLHCLRDAGILEVFVNGGEAVYTALL